MGSHDQFRIGADFSELRGSASKRFRVDRSSRQISPVQSKQTGRTSGYSTQPNCLAGPGQIGNEESVPIAVNERHADHCHGVVRVDATNLATAKFSDRTEHMVHRIHP